MFEHPITDALDLHSFAPRDIKVVIEEYLYQCVQRHFPVVRIIHGKGTGIQKEIVRKLLASSEYVESFHEGPDWGSTVVYLREEKNLPKS